MIRNINYQKIQELAAAVGTLRPEQCAVLVQLMPTLPALTQLDMQQGFVKIPAVVAYLDEQNLLSDYRSSDKEQLPTDLYAFIFAASHSTEELKNCSDYHSIHKAMQLNKDAASYIFERVLFAVCVLQLMHANLSWAEFTKGFSAKNWSDIHLLGALLPLGNATTEEGLDWLTLTMDVQQKDGAIGSLGKFIIEWISNNPSIAANIETKLPQITNDKHLRKFSSAFLYGLKKVQNKPTAYYQALLEPLIEAGNEYYIWYALGMIAKENKNESELFYSLILGKQVNGELLLRDFISLCTDLKLYRKELFSKIDAFIIATEDRELISKVINLLFFDTEKQIDRSWAKVTASHLMTKAGDEFKHSLDMLLMDFAEHELDTAYELFDLRIRVLSFMDLLENALAAMVRKDPTRFHQQLVCWFTDEDGHVHYALRHICSIHSLGKSIFRLPSKAFEGVSNKDKIFMAYKIAGYIYSKDEMQELMLSLIKSINDPSDIVYNAIHFIMTEYVVYNYRTTLEMMKDELEHNKELSPFAARMFQQLNEAYAAYFQQFHDISAQKELSPYKDHILLKSFHTRKRFSQIPKVTERNSFASLFKNTQLNSSRWAIRRTGQPKHVVQELGHVSFSTEFPSGENLDPIQQEYVRRVYQKLKKGEINID